MAFFGHTTPRARKPHRCNNCGTAIREGSHYMRSCYADAGALQTVRVHPYCATLAGALGYTDSDTWDEGEFRQDCYAYMVGPFPWEGAQ